MLSRYCLPLKFKTAGAARSDPTMNPTLVILDAHRPSSSRRRRRRSHDNGRRSQKSRTELHGTMRKICIATSVSICLVDCRMPGRSCLRPGGCEAASPADGDDPSIGIHGLPAYARRRDHHGRRIDSSTG